MKQHLANLDNIDLAANRFDIVIERLLIALLVFMPLAIGVVHRWSEEVVIILSAAIVICFSLKLLCNRRNEPLVWTWAYIPIAIFLFIPIFQLIALPASLLNIISPNTVALRTELLGDLPNAETFLGSMTLSFYPNATKHDLRLLLAIVAVFIVVLNVFRTSAQIKRLLTAIAILAGFFTVIALAQYFFGNGKIFWLITTSTGNDKSGPFVCHSHYAQFMNLSIGATIALLCVKLHETFAAKKITPPVVLEFLSSNSAKQIWLLLAIIGLGTATIFISLTRGGMISLIAAAAFTTLLLSLKKSLPARGWIMVAMAFIAFASILYVGFDAIYDRFASLRSVDSYKIRGQILKDITASYKLFPLLGTGLGTHLVVYPMFQTINITARFTHVENEYAQIVEETGLVGLAILIIFAIIFWRAFARNIRNEKTPIHSAAYGLGFGLLAILVHSLSDFGQHLPANSFLSAIFCALLLALTDQHKNHKSPLFNRLTNSQPLRVMAFIGVCAVCSWSIVGANNARIAESYWQKVRGIEKQLSDKDWIGTKAEYEDLISFAAQAVNYQPQNVEYQHWLNVYRWYSVTKTTDRDMDQTDIPEESMPFVRDIVEEFNKARLICPTYGPTYSIVGQIEKFIFNDDRGADKIRKGFRLASSNPEVCIVAGRLDILEGNPDASIEKFDKAIKLAPHLFKDIAYMYINYLSRPELAIAAAGDNITRLHYVAGMLREMQYYDLIAEIQLKMKTILEAKCSAPDPSASELVTLASIYRAEQNYHEAIKYYRLAVGLKYGQIHWRLDLAKLYAKIGQISKAIHEAKICLRLRPQFKAAKNFLSNISMSPPLSEKKS